MTPESKDTAGWLAEWMASRAIALWGIANLQDFSTPVDTTEKPFPMAVSWAYPMAPHIMAGVRSGPNQAYADEYARANDRINAVSQDLAMAMVKMGYRSLALAASARTDPVSIKGDFPHKTAATRAGLGWIGRHCQLITRPYGSWIRLGTVFVDLPLADGPPVERHFCGTCTRCVDACPAGALSGTPWHPGIARDRILDAKACDQWKKTHYLKFHGGHNCGICSAVCPFGLKTLRT